MNILVNFFLIVSFLFLCFSASEQTIPIKLGDSHLILFFLLIGSGFALINFDWIKNIDIKGTVNVPPENVADFLNKKLFGKYPYVFSIKPTSSVNLSGNRLTRLYSVRNKSFAELFVAYFDDSILIIITFLVVVVPFLFINQQAPSYLGLANRFWIGFGILGWLVTATWFSCISILILRVRCNYFVKKNLLKQEG